METFRYNCVEQDSGTAVDSSVIVLCTVLAVLRHSSVERWV